MLVQETVSWSQIWSKNLQNSKFSSKKMCWVIFSYKKWTYCFLGAYCEITAQTDVPNIFSILNCLQWTETLFKLFKKICMGRIHLFTFCFLNENWAWKIATDEVRIGCPKKGRKHLFKFQNRLDQKTSKRELLPFYYNIHTNIRFNVVWIPIQGWKALIRQKMYCEIGHR